MLSNYFYGEAPYFLGHDFSCKKLSDAEVTARKNYLYYQASELPESNPMKGLYDMMMGKNFRKDNFTSISRSSIGFGLPL